MAFLLKQDAVTVTSETMNKSEILEYLIHLVSSVYNLPYYNEILNLIMAREDKLSTGIGLGIAVPHCLIDKTSQIVVGAMLVLNGVEYNSVDGQPVKLIFLIISQVNDITGHIACLSSISRAVSDDMTRMKLLNSLTADELYGTIKETIT